MSTTEQTPDLQVDELVTVLCSVPRVRAPSAGIGCIDGRLRELCRSARVSGRELVQRCIARGKLGPASPRRLGVCCQCGEVAACLSCRRRMLSGCRSARDVSEPPTGSPRLGVVTATRLSSLARTCPTPILRLPGRCAGAAQWRGSAPGTRGRSRPPGGCGPAAGVPRAAPAGTSGSLELVRPLPALPAVTVPRGPSRSPAGHLGGCPGSGATGKGRAGQWFSSDGCAGLPAGQK